MRMPTEDPLRWRDERADTHSLQDRAALLVDAVADAPTVSPVALARIRTDVLAGRRARSARAAFRSPVGVRIAVGASLALLSMTAAGGATVLWRRYLTIVKPLPGAKPGDEASARANRRGTRRRHQAPSSVAAPSSIVEASDAPSFDEPSTGAPSILTAPPVTASPSVPPAAVLARAAAPVGVVSNQTFGHPTAHGAVVVRGPARLAASSPTSSPAAGGTVEDPSPGIALAMRQDNSPRDATSPIPIGPHGSAPGFERPGMEATTEPKNETEAHLLARAITQLRQGHDPRAALSTLARFDRLFPHGVLEPEAMRARLEAVIQLDDLTTALALLDARRTFTLPLDTDVLLTRAELRGRANRCNEAVADFSEVLARVGSGPAGGVAERALHGRAICLGRLGRDAQARADLIDYQRRFPRGRDLPDVRRLLGVTRPNEKNPR